MKLFLINIAKFACFFILLFCAILLFAHFNTIYNRNSEQNINISTIRNSIKFDSLDILFVGNSYAYSGIKPSLFDLENVETYNLAISSAGIEFYEILINYYLNNISQPPKMMTILISPNTFSSASDDFEVIPINRYLNTTISYFPITQDQNGIDQIFRFYRIRLKQSLKNILVKKSKRNYKGFYYSDKQYEDIKVVKEEYSKTFKNDKFDFQKVKKLSELVLKIEEKGIKVFYIELPTNNLEEYFNSDYLFSYNSFVNDISESDRLIKINKNLFNKNNFRDEDHLNNSGAEIVTREIISYFKLNHRHIFFF